jgi:hypothetical protein
MSGSTPSHSNLPLRAAVRQLLERNGFERVWLHTFWLVGVHRSCSKAAKLLELHDCTAVRKRLHRLKEVLGVDLVASDANGSRLTPAGVAVFPEVDGAFNPRVVPSDARPKGRDDNHFASG